MTVNTTDKEEVRKIIGNNLRMYRQKEKMTQDEFAEKAGISTPFLANVERGIKGLGISTLRDICRSLDISADYLLFDDTTSGHIKNIEMLLRDKPEHVAATAEKMVRLLVEYQSGTNPAEVD